LWYSVMHRTKKLF